jgi:hypothetical protein
MHILLLITLLPVAIAGTLVKAKREDVIPGKYIVKLKGDGLLSETISEKPDVEFSM